MYWIVGHVWTSVTLKTTSVVGKDEVRRSRENANGCEIDRYFSSEEEQKSERR